MQPRPEERRAAATRAIVEQRRGLRAAMSGASDLRAVTARVIAAVLVTVAGTGSVHSAPADTLMLASQVTAKRPGGTLRATATPPRASRPSLPVVTTSSTGADQAGYVHYFVITGPDGEPESQVGIELPGDRIVWSFPELGVVVSPFIASGSMAANGKSYNVEHLYGIRPFPDERSMRMLQQELTARVAPWIEDKTAYCNEERPQSQLCVSCLGFALRVLYPSTSSAFGALPVLPLDFKSARKNIYTTEDLLLYLTGVRVDAPSQARLKRIETLAIPEGMREQLMRVSSENDNARRVAAAQVNATKSAAKARTTTRSVVDLPKRVLSRRRS